MVNTKQENLYPDGRIVNPNDAGIEGVCNRSINKVEKSLSYYFVKDTKIVLDNSFKTNEIIISSTDIRDKNLRDFIRDKVGDFNSVRIRPIQFYVNSELTLLVNLQRYYGEIVPIYFDSNKNGSQVYITFGHPTDNHPHLRRKCIIER